MRYLYQIFLKGLLTLLPIFLTVYLLTWVVTFVEGALRRVLEGRLPRALDFPGAALGIAIALVLVVGLLVDVYFTKRIFLWVESKVEQMPVIRSIYGPLRDVTQLFARQGPTQNQKVVLVQLDRSDGSALEALGLVTRETFSDLPADLAMGGSVAVFFPFSYGMGGMTVLVSRKRIRETSLPPEKAMQLSITGWIKNSGNNG